MKIINSCGYTLLMVLLLLCKKSWSQVDSSKYEIYNTKNHQRIISWEDWMKNLKSASIIIWGEEHNDSIGHLLQRQFLESLHIQNNSKSLALSMEMFQTDVQAIMDEYISGWISEKNFKSEARAWNNYTDYAPMLNYCKENKIKVICANTPSRYTNMVTRGQFNALDQLPKSTRRSFLPPFPLDTFSGPYYEKFLEAMGGHINPNLYIYQSQNLWDASMANSILKASKKHRVFHINGRFHSDQYLGTTARVLQKTSKNVVTISCFQGQEYLAEEHKALADFVIITKAKND
jgi:uncharacterized iron-regulated protein